MNLAKIRAMNDEQLKKYLKSLSNRNVCVCIKCGKENSNYTINVQNKKIHQQKKLCSLCNNCYQEMLDKMEFEDIMWD